MTRRRVFRLIAILGISGIIIGGGIGLYVFNMPQRDVQSAETDFEVTSTSIVQEYLADKDAANQKYLSSDGNSKILEVSGVISAISEDFDGRKVVLLKNEEDLAGVSATFTTETESSLEGITIGMNITVKGVIRSGASYDEDLEFYLHVVLEKCAVL